MNTEIIDYFKKLSQKEFFFANFLSTALSIVILISGAISLIKGTSMLLYTIMFACAAAVLAVNSYKCFKSGKKNGWIFAVLAVGMAAVTVLGIMALAGGK